MAFFGQPENRRIRRYNAGQSSVKTVQFMDAIITSESEKSIVMIGLMGAGKSSVGWRLAEYLDLAFVDSDDEIVKAAGCAISDIFEVYGEQEFRKLEERVIERLLNKPRCVIATGGGAYMHPKTRAQIDQAAITIWLRADLDTLVERTGRRAGRPLLERGNPRQILQTLIDERYPVYANADIIVDSGGDSHDTMVQRIVSALSSYYEAASVK